MAPRITGHEGHQIHPHAHTRYEDGAEIHVKPCNGRFWCLTCRAWHDGPRCKDAPAVQPVRAGS